jgi:hypothetical protein
MALLKAGSWCVDINWVKREVPCGAVHAVERVEVFRAIRCEAERLLHAVLTTDCSMKFCLCDRTSGRRQDSRRLLESTRHVDDQ